ncbi:cytochrome P450 [Amylocystis lapponica]|nr:cytochrome P450 [Amylocystis lapponica]
MVSTSLLSSSLDSLDFTTAVLLAVGGIVLWHVVPWLRDPHGMRSYPGPFVAKFSDIWLGLVPLQATARRSHIRAHCPNHLSIADPEAIQTVYAHGNGTLKSEFYDAFVSIQPGLFNTRSRVDHARKRKIVSHIFSQKSVLEFEPYTRLHIRELIAQWDRLYDLAVKGQSGPEGEGGWVGRDGRLWLDCLPCLAAGDLAFGAPFGMLQACADAAPVAVYQKEAMQGADTEVTHFPAVRTLNDRGEFSASMGVLPKHWRPWVKTCVPWFRQGNTAVKRLAGIAVAALQEGKDDEGNPMGVPELTAEALTQLIAGSDTTSNSSCALTYHLAANPHVQQRLQRELDDALGSDDDPVATYEAVKRLPYLEAVISEGLRLHSTSGMGLPRTVPEGGLTVLGRYFPRARSLHRDTATWGADVDAFRPERWEECDKNAVQRAFNPFSFGPRSCVGRNLASMELLVIVASILRRYSFVLAEEGQKLETSEGFLRKPRSCRVGIRRRSA